MRPIINASVIRAAPGGGLIAAFIKANNWAMRGSLIIRPTLIDIRGRWSRYRLESMYSFQSRRRRPNCQKDTELQGNLLCSLRRRPVLKKQILVICIKNYWNGQT